MNLVKKVMDDQYHGDSVTFVRSLHAAGIRAGPEPLDWVPPYTVRKLRSWLQAQTWKGAKAIFTPEGCLDLQLDPSTELDESFKDLIMISGDLGKAYYYKLCNAQSDCCTWPYDGS